MMQTISVPEHFHSRRLKLKDILNATKKFSKAHVIGVGGFGTVYKGEMILPEGQTMVAVKRLNSESRQGAREFWNEICMLSTYKHENIVCLLGFCDENGEMILIYEFAPNKCLELYLGSNDLTWIKRLKISIGVAKGLAYLHSDVGGQQKVFHRDVKSANVLLDENWHAKISDFGLSRYGQSNKQISFAYTNAVGTFGYVDPLYMKTGLLTKESDVYSFGVVLFEVLSGRLCISREHKGEAFSDLMKKSYEDNKLTEIVFHNLINEIRPESMKEFTKVAYQCLSSERTKRPLMKDVVIALENALKYQLSPDEAYSSEILLAQRKIDLPLSFKAVLALDSSIMKAHKIADLIKLLPTSEEIELMKGYTGVRELLGKRGEFILECQKIPRLATKLQVFAFTISFSRQVNEITGYLNRIKEATKEIMESQNLACMMKEYDEFLAHRHRGHLDGLWFNNIQHMKEDDLFLFYCKAEEERPVWFDLHKDLIHLDAASEINIEDLRKQKSAILKEVEKAQQELNASAKDGEMYATFAENLKTFLDSADGHSSLTNFFDDVNRDADSLVEYFRAEPIHQSWTKVVRLLARFIDKFQEQNSVLEQKRREKQEEEDAKQKEAERIKMEKEFAAEPVYLRAFVLWALAVEKTFDRFFTPLE